MYTTFIHDEHVNPPDEALEAEHEEEEEEEEDEEEEISGGRHPPEEDLIKHAEYLGVQGVQKSLRTATAPIDSGSVQEEQREGKGSAVAGRRGGFAGNGARKPHRFDHYGRAIEEMKSLRRASVSPRRLMDDDFD
jgi:hypothetical protein